MNNKFSQSVSFRPRAILCLPFFFVISFLFLAHPDMKGAELKQGAILRMQTESDSDTRFAPSLALFVPEGQPVSPFLSPGPFTARFEAILVLEKRSRLVFSLEGTGEARLLIDDEVLVEGIGKPNESERISSGEHKLVIEYKSPHEGDAQLRLFWEERDFSREPIPGSVLFHDPADADLTAGETLRAGRIALAQRQCVSCHEAPGKMGMPEALLAGPSLTGIGNRIRQDWLAKWIANPSSLRPSAHMPTVFKEGAEEKAADIAAYLASGAEKEAVSPETSPELVEKGGRLFYEQGCIACHTLEETGDENRIGLKAIGGKFRHGALASFLKEPTKYHEASRMPSFAFSDDEAAALEGFLRSLQSVSGENVPEGNVENGKQLFTTSGCLDCHDRGEEESTLGSGPPLLDLSSSVCSAMSFSSGEPHSGIEALLGSKEAKESLSQFLPAEFADRQFTGLRCNACHSQSGSETLREQYAPEVAHLKPPPPPANEEKPAIETGPPPLDHLGLKLRPEWRTKLFAGEIVPKVREWIPARMPAYPTRAAILSAGFSHTVGLPSSSPPDSELDPAKLEIGKAMIGIQNGLGCVTCHGVGAQPPMAVFEGEGPNFEDAGARLTHEYFHLWMNDPARAWSGTIMPKYAVDGKTPLTQHYEGDAAKQFEAIYDYLRSLARD